MTGSQQEISQRWGLRKPENFLHANKTWFTVRVPVNPNFDITGRYTKTKT